MYRVDDLLAQARLVRIRRAARRHAMAERRMRRSAVDDEAWFEEQKVVAAVLSGLAKVSAKEVSAKEVSAKEASGKEAAPAKGRRSDVVDLSLLSPFVEACLEALGGVAERFGALPAEPGAKARLVGELARAWHPALDEAVGGNGREVKPRTEALSDVAALAVEWAMFEAVSRIARKADLSRRVSSRSDPDDIVVEDGRAWRVSRRLKEAERQGGRRARIALDKRIKALTESGLSEVEALVRERDRLDGVPSDGFGPPVFSSDVSVE